jgi:hypothetical protein
MNERNQIPADAVLLIPEPDQGEAPAYGIAPGYYNPKQLLELLDQKKEDPDAISFIADMLETGNPTTDGFATTLRSNSSNYKTIIEIVKAASE